ncbi:mate-domain-containing protein [Pelagophyceae sp. CCMP2097]|nr:mate-domain-containing protein [Pelagophyceae sp. CCMP2097]|mmetsp:Transcript_3002/g.8967  ORF Transcript_3002/g.8967 Transcript_3002/m.8967 type:complete len:528 (-) Transcript_3002:29-1612(-)
MTRASMMREELALLLRLGLPNTLTQLLQFMPGIAVLGYMRRPFVKEADALAGAGMGIMFCNVVGMSMICGFGGACAPLAAQAFGAGNSRRVGEVVQRNLLVLLALLVPISLAFASAGPALTALGQPAHVAALVARFAVRRIPALPCITVGRTLTDLLVAVNAPWLTTGVSLAAASMAIFNCWLFIDRLGLGFDGAPLALTVADASWALLLALLAPRAVPDGCWPRWAWRTAAAGWVEIVSIALPAAAMMWCEWWGWEVMVLFAGLTCPGRQDGADSELPCPALDAFPILSNTMVYAFMVHYGFSIAAGARIGNLLGEGAHERAQTVAYTALGIVVAISVPLCIGIVAFRGSLVAFYTDDPAVAQVAAKTMPLVAAYVMLDSVGPGLLNKVFGGLAYVRAPAINNVCAVYLVGIPLGLYLAFPGGRGVTGLWVGLVTGLFTMVVGLCVILLTVDWKQAAEDAVHRSHDDAGTAGKKPTATFSHIPLLDADEAADTESVGAGPDDIALVVLPHHDAPGLRDRPARGAAV